ncbi:F0F1 ATP synthase subunit B [Patescibacteria group bacterium]|nr:F0F1 ATP synthase subunit B [Patescibacteria group bacterium]MCH8889310.1 F0F1 ATP synthase subunit B [Patescibacteria group bacterium]
MGDIINTFGVDWRLLVIQAINFGLLLLILWHFLYKPVTQMLEKRRLTIEKGVKDAEKVEVKLASMKEYEDKIIDKATQKASQLVEEGKQRATIQEAELMQQAEARSSHVLKEAHQKAEEAKRKALEDSQGEIARLAILGAEKILKKHT